MRPKRISNRKVTTKFETNVLELFEYFQKNCRLKRLTLRSFTLANSSDEQFGPLCLAFEGEYKQILRTAPVGMQKATKKDMPNELYSSMDPTGEDANY